MYYERTLRLIILFAVPRPRRRPVLGRGREFRRKRARHFGVVRRSRRWAFSSLVLNLASIPNVREGWLQEIGPDVVGQRNRDDGDHTQQFVEHAATAAAPHHSGSLFSRLVSLERSLKLKKRQKRAELLCYVDVNSSNVIMRQLISAVSVRGQRE